MCGKPFLPTGIAPVAIQQWGLGPRGIDGLPMLLTLTQVLGI